MLSITLFPHQLYQYYHKQQNTPKEQAGFSASQLKDGNDSLKSRDANRWTKPQGTYSSKLQTYKVVKEIWF